MQRFILAVVLLASPALASSGSAQEPQSTGYQATPSTPPPAVIITTSPGEPVPSQAYYEYELEDAKERSRRVRIALISTSASFAAGLILAGIGASQCEYIDRVYSYDDIICNNAGNVLVPLGGAFLTVGVIGMITSGIMLGVRNKQKRDTEREMRRRYYGGRLRWDAESGGVVF